MRPLNIATALAFCLSFLLLPAQAQAGPLLDWIKDKCGKKNQTTPVGYMATSGSFTNAPTYLQPGQCQQTCLQTCQRVTVNYVPYTDYRTTWQRVPVTNYRPVTSTDPNTGCVTTCMRPCTDHQWQLQRIPYTTYRPVYQTQNYQVPVTTITNDCGVNNGCTTCGVASPGCTTCGIPGGVAAPAAGYYPGTTGAIPNTYGTPQPADGVPVLGAQVPVADPYAGLRQGSFRPAFPSPNGVAFSNPYASPTAYSGMSTYSGFQTPSRRSAPPTFSTPTPSSFDAPSPEMGTPSTRSGSPSSPLPILRDNLGQGTTPSRESNVEAPVPGNNWQDPQPALRWEYNTPSSGPSFDQSAHRDVQQKWAYSPVRLASYQTMDSAAPTTTETTDSTRTNNSDWQDDSRAPRTGYNSDWN
ncbi:MAG: hypothetical protein JNL67_19870 [Planctomycetaceae bacterium]|nr:hypothetical protein [Planctomycetaceae bacterium]